MKTTITIEIPDEQIAAIANAHVNRMFIDSDDSYRRPGEAAQRIRETVTLRVREAIDAIDFGALISTVKIDERVRAVVRETVEDTARKLVAKKIRKGELPV